MQKRRLLIPLCAVLFLSATAMRGQSNPIAPAPAATINAPLQHSSSIWASLLLGSAVLVGWRRRPGSRA
ncbi:MAG TPA: hypothetical protein VHY22_03745 [Chthoniobacteraceae bacterium]|jgi:hypothetical protein|nr:hypothetical protein [Chthoniobacteraceae bacterium]